MNAQLLSHTHTCVLQWVTQLMHHTCCTLLQKGERLTETLHINRSLSSLAQVFDSLAKQSSHVPYRNSKLTHFLKDSLGTACRAGSVVMVMHCITSLLWCSRLVSEDAHGCLRCPHACLLG